MKGFHSDVGIFEICFIFLVSTSLDEGELVIILLTFSLHFLFFSMNIQKKVSFLRLRCDSFEINYVCA